MHLSAKACVESRLVSITLQAVSEKMILLLSLVSQPKHLLVIWLVRHNLLSAVDICVILLLNVLEVDRVLRGIYELLMISQLIISHCR
jgi:hypothetical protein